MSARLPLAGPLRAAVLLALVAVCGTGVVAWVHQLSATRIAQNEAAVLDARLASLLSGSGGSPATERELLVPGLSAGLMPAAAGGIQIPRVHRARRDGQVVAVVVEALTRHGYNGTIAVLVAIDPGGAVLGVRALRHRETPGLGDAIETRRSNWIHRFEGISLALAERAWQVRRDGGEFDQLSGATVTSRALLGVVRQSLLYFRAHRQALLSTPAT